MKKYNGLTPELLNKLNVYWRAANYLWMNENSVME